MAKVGIGVLSFAHGHIYAYCDQIMGFEEVKLIACWDDDRERGEEAAGRYGMGYSPHLEDILNNSQVQAVFITSETSHHAALAVAAARAGKDIICQKPMALSLSDCDRMIEAVEKAGVKFTMAYQMRHDPANRKMKELLDSGAIGKVGVLRRRHCIGVLFSEGFVQGKTRWHIDPEKNMGMFMDDASHAADFFLWMLGMPQSVTAEIDNILTDIAPDDNGVAIYRFQNGEMGILFNSSTVWAGENTTEIYGDQGVIIQNYGDGPSCAMPRPAEAAALRMFQPASGNPGWQDLGIPIPASHGERISAVSRPMIDMLVKDLPPYVSAREGRQSVEMILGAYRSSKEGRRVGFPLSADNP